MSSSFFSSVMEFLSTPSARRATRGLSGTIRMTIFLSTPSARRATAGYVVIGDTLVFLSTPSARRATVINFAVYEDSIISIHALREEGDLLRVKSSKSSSYFYPRPPRGGRPLDM